MKDTVEFARIEHTENMPLWQLVSDAAAGEHAVKRQFELYLPRPNPLDRSSEAEARYKQYMQRATYYNATGRTLSGMIGMAFNKWPEIELPPGLEYLMDDVDGAGIPLIGQSMKVLGQILKTGRAGLLVDFPTVQEYGQTSMADMQSGAARATINYYPAESIINWRTERIGASQVLTMVVMREQVNQFESFGYSVETIYRVLRLNGGIYTQEVWVKREDAEDAEYEIDTVSMPLDGNGQPWKEIPFQFVGALFNVPELQYHGGTESYFPDTMVSPLFDIAVLNIAHFRNSADYEESVFMCGQPQPWMSGLSEEWRDKLVEQGISIGSRTVIPLPAGGAFGIAQAGPNPLVKVAMADKELQMQALGANLLDMGSIAKTATQAKFEAGKDHSVLSLACDNISDAYRKVLGWAARFMGADENAVEYNIDTQFVVNPLDAPSIQATVAAWQAGAVPDSDMWSMMRKTGVIDTAKTDDEIRMEIEQQTPNGGLPAILSAGNGIVPAPVATPAPTNPIA
jgi:hypothetical protein